MFRIVNVVQLKKEGKISVSFLPLKFKSFKYVDNFQQMYTMLILK